MDSTSATIIILGSTAILMAVATWLGWMRYRGRIDELPTPLRGPGAIVAMIAAFVVVIFSVLTISIVSH